MNLRQDWPMDEAARQSVQQLLANARGHCKRCQMSDTAVLTARFVPPGHFSVCLQCEGCGLLLGAVMPKASHPHHQQYPPFIAAKPRCPVCRSRLVLDVDLAMPDEATWRCPACGAGSSP